MALNINALLPTVYAALDQVSREMVGFVPAVSRDSGAERAAKGQTISSPVVPALTAEDATPGDTPGNTGGHTIGTVDMSIYKSRVVAVPWTGEEQRGVSLSGQLQAVQRRQFAQAMRALVNEMDGDIAGEYVRASRAYGTAGTTPFGTDLSDAAEVLKILKDNGAPDDGDLNLVADTSAGANMRSLAQLTDVNRAGTDDPLRRGVLRDIYGFSLRESAQVKTHVSGSVNATVDGSHSKYATSIAVTGTSISLKEGDVVHFGGDHKYVVAAPASSLPGTLQIREPGLRAPLSGGEAAQVSDDYVANLAFHRTAIHAVTRAPAMPDGGDSSDDITEVTDPSTGIAFQVALYRQYRQVRFEIGLAWGVKAIKPEHAALLIG